MNKTFNDPNLKYSDQLTPLAQMAGFEGGSSDLPTPTAADAGKVLTVDETGAYELGDVDALPAISAGDAGKVLTVNAGETGAEWATPSGGGGNVFIVTLTYSDSGWTSNKTYSQIDSAYQNGDLILAKAINSNYIALVSYVSGSGYAGYTTDYMFVTRKSNTNYMTFGSVLIQSDGTILDNLTGNAQCVIFESNV